MTINIGIIAVKGGAGSGNWGHVGRPGMVGGSGGRGGRAAGPTIASSADKKWVGSLTGAETDAVKGYMNAGPAWAGSASINAALRRDDASGNVARNIELLDAAIARAPRTDSELTLYRSLPAGAEIGGGFISAMRQQEYVTEYTGGGRVVVEFTVPANTPVAPASALFFPYSEEVLLPRGVDIVYQRVVQ